jgi:hypothetical protein
MTGNRARTKRVRSEGGASQGTLAGTCFNLSELPETMRSKTR